MEIVAPLIGLDWTLGMFAVTFIVLFLILKKFLFERVYNFMQAREQKVKDQFDSAEAAEKQAEEHLTEYRAKLEDAETERRGLLKDAKSVADARAEQIIKDANDRAEEIVNQARKEMEQERIVFAESMKEQVAMLAIYAAEKIIEKELKESEHMLLIDGILKEGDIETWSH